MTRRRYVYNRDTGEMEEISLDAQLPSREAKNFLVGDRHYDGLRALDGADIGTRTKHRAYMKSRGLTTLDDFKDTFKKAEKARIDAKQGRDPSRKEDIARAMTRPKRFGFM